MIQLAWRQYQRRKLLHYTLRRKKILHQWTPRYSIYLSIILLIHPFDSVLAAKQRLLVEKVYGKPHPFIKIIFMVFIGQELKVAQYEPPKPRPMVRPAYLELVPSPAGM